MLDGAALTVLTEFAVLVPDPVVLMPLLPDGGVAETLALPPPGDEAADMLPLLLPGDEDDVAARDELDDMEPILTPPTRYAPLPPVTLPVKESWPV